MDLFQLFIGSAISAGFGKAIDVLFECFKCDQKDEQRIGNRQFNSFECGNCHADSEQFTNACKFTVNPKTLEIGQAAIERTNEFHWTRTLLFFPGEEFKIPYRIYTKGLRNRPLVLREKFRRYDGEKLIKSEIVLIKPITNSSLISLDTYHSNKSFVLKDDRTIIALDLVLESEHHDIVFQDRWLINPWSDRKILERMLGIE